MSEEMPSEEMPSEEMPFEEMLSEAAARAEERAAAVPRPALPPARDRRRAFGVAASPRARLTLGLALLMVLAAAWIVVGRGAVDDPGAPAPAATPTVTNRATPRVDLVVAVPRCVPADVAATCRAYGASPSRVVVDCTPGRGVVRLRYRAFASVADLRAAYAVESTRRGGGGPSACAAGTPEERSWSSAASPARPVGRYRCSLVAGTARLMWTSEEALVLGLATRSDSDLRALYQWWTTVPGPDAPG
jgi:hypothetical protein